MIYAGRIQNQQYSQYANRAAGYKPDYAGITKRPPSPMTGCTERWSAARKTPQPQKRKCMRKNVSALFPVCRKLWEKAG